MEIDNEKTSVLDRRIAHANKVITLHDSYETPTTVVFWGKKGEPNMKLSQKLRELFDKVKSIDDTAKIKDTKDITYTKSKDMPEGTAFAEAFPIDDSEKKYGNIYIKCEIISKFSLNELKHGQMNIMDYLKENKIFLKFRKFKTTRRSYFLSSNP